MKYIFSLPAPFERFVSIEMVIETTLEGDSFELQLPSWRPGRYELGNFAKNIRGLVVSDSKGTILKHHKVSKDCWKVQNGQGPIHIKYSYFASQPDAGACWVDHEQLYINPIHCCFFIPGRESEKCEVLLNIPPNWKVATGMRSAGTHTFEAGNFEQLVDSPFIASPSMQHGEYTVEGINFHVWLQGDCNPDWLRIIRDFEAFTVAQLKMMKTFPVSEFHFLVQILPFPFYHGVEHTNSTVLAMGPGYNFMKPAFYDDFMGVASHELFHVWNVKTIRPVEMLPYDYTRENYAETGYVYEGVTTYYGDLFLARSGYFNLTGLLSEYTVRLQKHMDNPGRFNHSVAESSFDTWLDGYVPGVPGRKVSIYDEGCLIAWMLDFMIRSSTESKRSLDNVMQVLYFDFANKGIGYTKDDFKQVCEIVAGRNFDEFFEGFVYKAVSYETMLCEVISLAGISIQTVLADANQEKIFGFKTEQRGADTFVISVSPGSPAHQAGLVKDDEILAVENVRVENNLSDLIRTKLKTKQPLRVLSASNKQLREIVLTATDLNYFSKYVLRSEEHLTNSQLQFRQSWLS